MAWTPSTPNGWYPYVWAEGADVYVSYGWEACYLAHLRAEGGALTLVREAQIAGRSAYSGQWLAPWLLTVWETRPDLGPDLWQRSELDVRGDWTLRVVEPAAATVGGNWTSARGGHRRVQRPSWLRYDGIEIATGTGAGAQAGEWISAAEDITHATILQWRAGLPTGERRPVLTPLHQIGVGEDGSTAYGGYGPIRGWRPGGPDVDLTVTPWRDEGAPYLWDVGGALWLASTTFGPTADAARGVLLRPFGDLAVVVVPGEAIFATVATAAGWSYVAACDGVGRLTVTAVAVDAPRAVLPPSAPPALVVAPYDAPKAIGAWMVTSQRYGAWPAAGNCEVLSDGVDPALQVVARPVFATVDVLTRYTLRVPLLGVVCGDVAGIDEVRAQCARFGVGAVLYTDDEIFAEAYRAVARPGDWLAPQCYRLAHETAAEFEARCTAEVDRLTAWGLPILLVAGWFNRQDSSTTAELTRDQVVECLPVFDRLLRRAVVEGQLPFAYGRPGGIRDLGLDADLAAFADASPGLPDPEPPDPEPPDPPDPEPPDPPDPEPVPTFPALARRLGGFAP